MLEFELDCLLEVLRRQAALEHAAVDEEGRRRGNAKHGAGGRIGFHFLNGLSYCASKSVISPTLLAASRTVAGLSVSWLAKNQAVSLSSVAFGFPTTAAAAAARAAVWTTAFTAALHWGFSGKWRTMCFSARASFF